MKKSIFLFSILFLFSLFFVSAEYVDITVDCWENGHCDVCGEEYACSGGLGEWV